MGGGGTSGAVEFPGYTMETHAQLMAGSVLDNEADYANDNPDTPNTSVITSYNTALNDNPYTGLNVSNPAEFIQTDKLSNFSSEVSNFGTSSIDDVVNSALRATAQTSVGDFQNIGLSTSDIQDLSTNARTSANLVLDEAVDIASTVAGTQEIADLVSEFKDRRELQEQQQIAQYNARMADGGAVNSSAYGIGLALLHSEHVRAESEFDAQLSLEAYNRAFEQFVQTYINDVQGEIQLEQLSLEADVQTRQTQEQRYIRSLRGTLQLLTNKREFNRALTEAQLEVDRTETQSHLNYHQVNSEMEQKDALWELLVAEQTANILSAPGGMARRLPENKPLWEELTGKAIQGAAAYATVAAAASDRRLKENIRWVGQHSLGFGIYLFDYKWGRRRNVLGYIAQEVGEVFPEAVGTFPNGDFFVRYDLV